MERKICSGGGVWFFKRMYIVQCTPLTHKLQRLKGWNYRDESIEFFSLFLYILGYLVLFLPNHLGNPFEYYLDNLLIDKFTIQKSSYYWQGWRVRNKDESKKVSQNH